MTFGKFSKQDLMFILTGKLSSPNVTSRKVQATDFLLTSIRCDTPKKYEKTAGY